MLRPARHSIATGRAQRTVRLLLPIGKTAQPVCITTVAFDERESTVVLKARSSQRDALAIDIGTQRAADGARAFQRISALFQKTRCPRRAFQIGAAHIRALPSRYDSPSIAARLAAKLDAAAAASPLLAAAMFARKAVAPW